MILPGIGTAVGGVIGNVIGSVSSGTIGKKVSGEIFDLRVRKIQILMKHSFNFEIQRF